MWLRRYLVTTKALERQLQAERTAVRERLGDDKGELVLRVVLVGPVLEQTALHMLCSAVAFFRDFTLEFRVSRPDVGDLAELAPVEGEAVEGSPSASSVAVVHLFHPEADAAVTRTRARLREVRHRIRLLASLLREHQSPVRVYMQREWCVADAPSDTNGGVWLSSGRSEPLAEVLRGSGGGGDREMLLLGGEVDAAGGDDGDEADGSARHTGAGVLGGGSGGGGSGGGGGEGGGGCGGGGGRLDDGLLMGQRTAPCLPSGYHVRIPVIIVVIGPPGSSKYVVARLIGRFFETHGVSNRFYTACQAPLGDASAMEQYYGNETYRVRAFRVSPARLTAGQLSHHQAHLTTILCRSVVRRHSWRDSLKRQSGETLKMASARQLFSTRRSSCDVSVRTSCGERQHGGE